MTANHGLHLSFRLVKGIVFGVYIPPVVCVLWLKMSRSHWGYTCIWMSVPLRIHPHDFLQTFSSPQDGDLLQQRGTSQWLPGALPAQEADGVRGWKELDQWGPDPGAGLGAQTVVSSAHLPGEAQHIGLPHWYEPHRTGRHSGPRIFSCRFYLMKETFFFSQSMSFMFFSSSLVSLQVLAFSSPAQLRWMIFDLGSSIFGTTLSFLTYRRGPRMASRWETEPTNPENGSVSIQFLLSKVLRQEVWEMSALMFLPLVCCDASGPRPEGGMGGPGGVGEGHPSLAVCPAGPGQAVPPASPQHRLLQPRSAPRGEASQGDPAQLHGIWSAGKRQSPSRSSLVSFVLALQLKWILQNCWFLTLSSLF